MSLKSALGFSTESMLTETKGPSSGGPVAGCSLPQGPQPQESEWETVEARLSAIRVVALEEANRAPQALITRIHTNKNIFPFFF